MQNLPIVSLQTGGLVGNTGSFLIDPNNLKVEGWFATSRFLDKDNLILPTSQIRGVESGVIFVNDRDAITPAEDLVRLKPLINLNYQLTNKLVVGESKKHYGRVEDFALDDGFFVQRIYVQPVAIKIFSQQRITVTRSQIIEITDRKIVIKDPLDPKTIGFRQSLPATEV